MYLNLDRQCMQKWRPAKMPFPLADSHGRPVTCMSAQGTAPPGSLDAYAALAGQAIPALVARTDAGLRQAFCEVRRTRHLYGMHLLFYCGTAEAPCLS